ncbi:MAG: hypothetical protein WAV20_24835 [Blastocatellia bacterium]
MGVILGFIVGAFGLGFLASSTVKQAELEQHRLRIQALEQQLDKVRKEFQTSEKKNDLGKLASRAKKIKQVAAKSPSDKALQRAAKEAFQNIASFIDNNVDQDKDENNVPAMRIVRGDTPAESAIKFRDDPNLYVVPPEVKKLTKRATWYRADGKALENLKLYSPNCPEWEPLLPDLRTSKERPLSIDIVRIP